MTIKLFCNAIIKFVLGIILVGLLLFLPAGTIQYPNGWLFMSILFVPMFVAGIVMMFKNPKLLTKTSHTLNGLRTLKIQYFS